MSSTKRPLELIFSEEDQRKQKLRGERFGTAHNLHEAVITQEQKDVEDLQHEICDAAKTNNVSECRQLLSAASCLVDMGHLNELVNSSLVNAQPRGRNGSLRWSPLHQAAFNNNMELVQLLLHSRADPAAETSNGKQAHELTEDDSIRDILLKRGSMQSRSLMTTETPMPSACASLCANTALDIVSRPSAESISASSAGEIQNAKLSGDGVLVPTPQPALQASCADEVRESCVPGEIQTWCAQHNLPQGLVDRFNEELITTVDEILELSPSDIDKLCEGLKLGIKARLKLIVKKSAKA